MPNATTKRQTFRSLVDSGPIVVATGARGTPAELVALAVP